MAIVSTACKVCGSKDDEDAMLLCDGCDAGYHIYCMDPPMEEVPDGDWFCKDCQVLTDDKQLYSSTHFRATFHNRVEIRHTIQLLSLSLTELLHCPLQAAGAGTAASVDNKKGGSSSSRVRRRKSRWSSGVVPKKKPAVKKKVLESEGEDGGEKGEEEQELGVSNLQVTEPPGGDLTPASPRPHQSAEQPSVPTGVRIDSSRLAQWEQALVRTTDQWTVEKLERVYTAMAKVKLSGSWVYSYLGLLYCTVLYCNVLYCTVLYCIVLYEGGAEVPDRDGPDCSPDGAAGGAGSGKDPGERASPAGPGALRPLARQPVQSNKSFRFAHTCVCNCNTARFFDQLITAIVKLVFCNFRL